MALPSPIIPPLTIEPAPGTANAAIPAAAPPNAVAAAYIAPRPPILA